MKKEKDYSNCPDCSMDLRIDTMEVKKFYFYPGTNKTAFYIHAKEDEYSYSEGRKETSLDFPYEDVIKENWEKIISIEDCLERQILVDDLIDKAREDFEKNIDNLENYYPDCSYDEDYLFTLPNAVIYKNDYYGKGTGVAFYIFDYERYFDESDLEKKIDNAIHENIDKIFSMKDCDSRQAFVNNLVDEIIENYEPEDNYEMSYGFDYYDDSDDSDDYDEDSDDYDEDSDDDFF